MLAVAVLAFLAPVTTTLPPPGGALDLAPLPAAASTALVPASGGGRLPAPARPERVGFFSTVLAAIVVAARREARGRIRRAASVPVVPEDVVVVFVPGHGQALEGDFDFLIGTIGLAAQQVRHFDYRWVQPVDDHRRAAREATNEELADGLHSYLAGLADVPDRRIYLVGFSKGGAAIAALMRRWDLHPADRIEAVFGAALLDPPIASGGLGALQSAGKWLPVLPSDGGYRPDHCRLLWRLNCRDSRIDLGDTAGVEVVVFRNGYSELTNLADRPEGLRVNDVTVAVDPALGVLSALSAAHQAVLRSTAVGECLADEMSHPATCDWEARLQYSVAP